MLCALRVEIAPQAEMSIISAEEGLFSFRGRTYMLQDGGAGMVQVVDVQDNELLYWNREFSVSKNDIDEWRRRQFADTRNALLASKVLLLRHVLCKCMYPVHAPRH
jgi:hypothetical protein